MILINIKLVKLSKTTTNGLSSKRPLKSNVRIIHYLDGASAFSGWHCSHSALVISGGNEWETKITETPKCVRYASDVVSPVSGVDTQRGNRVVLLYDDIVIRTLFVD